MKTIFPNVLSRYPVAAAAVFLTATSALAEKYVELPNAKWLSDDVTLIDVDSPKVNPATKGVEFKYRRSSPSMIGGGRSTLEYTAIAWCSQMTIWDIRVDGVGSSHRFPVEEFYKEGQGWLKIPHVYVANFFEPMGKLIAAACDAGQPAAMDEFLQVGNPAECITTLDPYKKTLCYANPDERASVLLLTKRVSAIGQKCGNSARLDKIWASQMERFSRCGSSPDCLKWSMGPVAAIINSDARELEIWESNGSPQPFPIGKVCNAETNFKKLSDDEKNRTALQDAISKKSEAFLACAKRNIAKLDDRHSDASVVMRAVYRPCSEEFYQFYKAHKEINDRSEPEALKKQMEDRLLELVLLYRSSSKSK